MICQLDGPEARARYHAALAGEPSPPAVLLGCNEQAFGALPGSGWRFFAGGTGEPPLALAVRGASAWACGQAQPQELQSFLSFCGVKKLLVVPGGALPPGFVAGGRLCWLALPAESKPEAPTALPGLRLDEDVPMGRVVELLRQDAPQSEAFYEDYYSDGCTKRNRGLAQVWGIWQGDRLVSTGGVYALYGGGAYLAGIQTASALRGQGIGGWLVTEMAARLLGQGLAPCLLCRPERVAFYTRLGFVSRGELTKWMLKE